MAEPTASSVLLRDLVRAHRKAIADVMSKCGATNSRLFGSVARDDAVPQRCGPLGGPGQRGGDELLRIAGLSEEPGLSEELGVMLGHRVDVVHPGSLRSPVSMTAALDAIAI